MTFATSHSERRSGFSLVELLVVIGIIVILASIALPMLIKAYSQADKSKAAADLQSIAVALEAYKSDHGGYPSFPGDPNTNKDRGARALCRALIGPADVQLDGATGNGFRTRVAQAGPDGLWNTPDDILIGKAWGPYLQLDRLKIVTTTPGVIDDSAKLATKDGKIILYYPRVSTLPVTAAPNVIVGTTATSRYNNDDNSGPGLFTSGPSFMSVMLGDTDASNLQNGSESVVNQPYLLWTPGADGTYGPTAASKAAAAACDDVTNIQK